MAVQLSMKGRLAVLATLALFGLCVLAALAIGSNRINQHALQQLYEDDIDTLVRLQRAENALLEVRFRVAGVLLDQLPIPGSLNHVREMRKALAAGWVKSEPGIARVFSAGDGLATFTTLRNNWKLVDATLAKLEAAYVAKDNKVLAAVLEDDWAQLHQGVIKPLQALIPEVQKLGESAYGSAVQQSRALLLVGLATGGLCLVAVGTVAWLAGRSLLRPLVDVERAMRHIADGDLAAPIPPARRDELGRMIAALADMQTRLRALVTEVHFSTDGIQTASAEIAGGTQDLSSRTEQAAGNLQQTASSMEQLTGTVRQSAESARQANQLAASAAEVALRGGQVVSQVVATMDEISGSSRKIADIIGVIDGIAFQTNILALNAAVEAARAGEQGRGFAVVASEVRELAQRSASAAKEIKALIGTSVQKVESGSRLVADAGQTMSEIVGSVRRVSDIIGEISAAAAEQSDGIGQVNAAVTQLDQMTQQNAALVEQSAAAADMMKEQAVRLAQVVGNFKIGEGARA